MIGSVAAVRPGVSLRQVPGPADELVLHGGGGVFRLPLTPAAADRLLLLVRMLRRLRPLLPVPLPALRPGSGQVLLQRADPRRGAGRPGPRRPTGVDGWAPRLGRHEDATAGLDPVLRRGLD